jgi:hypothetical protein
MKRLLLLFVFVAAGFASNALLAQNPDSLKRDSVRIIPPLLDSALYGVNVFDVLSKPSANGATVKVFQTENIKNALLAQIARSASRKLQGYRIRIYFDNNQNARVISQNTAARFSQLYPSIPVYPTYSNPFFKVTVGDFRNKSEAMKLLKELEPVFKSAFLVREIINYPPL